MECMEEEPLVSASESHDATPEELPSAEDLPGEGMRSLRDELAAAAAAGHEEDSPGQQGRTQQSSASASHRKRVFSRAKLTLSAASRLLRRKIPQSGHLMLPKRMWMQTVPTLDCEVVVVLSARMEEKTLNWLQAQVRTRLTELSITVKNHHATNSLALYLAASYDGLIKAGEEMRIVKRTKLEYGGGLRELSHTELPIFQGVEDGHSFFSSEERQSIVLHILNSLRAIQDEQVQNCRLWEGQVIVPVFKQVGLIHQILPLHEYKKLEELRRTWVQTFFKYQPLDNIKEYFGPKIAVYFAWLGHYTASLSVPAIIGGVFWVFLWGRNQALEDKGFVLFALVNVVWSSAWLEAWKRRASALAYYWGTLDTPMELLEEPRHNFTGVLQTNSVTGRLEPYYPSWKRVVFRSLVTIPVIATSILAVFVVMLIILQLQDIVDTFITQNSYSYACLISYAPKMLMALVISFFDEAYAKVAIWLNDMENYRLEETYQNHLITKLAVFRFVNSFLALFYIAFYLQDMERLKEQLAALLLMRQVVGNIKESCIPYMMEQLKLAKMSFDLYGALSPSEEDKLQEWPQEKKDENIIRDSNTDVAQKKSGDETDYRRGSSECQNIDADDPQYKDAIDTNREQENGGNKEEIKDIDEDLKAEVMKTKEGTAPLSRGCSKSRLVGQAEVESNMSRYEGTFEDYLEMFIQFGYVLLFSSAFPLAASCALLNNLIEIRSDAFKLCCVFQRPFGQKVQSIGVWQDAMELMGLVGIVVNCMLIGMSGQVHRMFPEMSTTQTILLIIGLEHIMIAVKYGISYAIPDIPEWVAKEMAKIEFQRREALRRVSTSNSPPTRDDSGPPSPRYMYGSSMSSTEFMERSSQTDYLQSRRRSLRASSPGINVDGLSPVESNKEFRSLNSPGDETISDINGRQDDFYHYPKQIIKVGRSISACEKVRHRIPRTRNMSCQGSIESNDSEEDLRPKPFDSIPLLSAPPNMDSRARLFKFSPIEQDRNTPRGRIQPLNSGYSISASHECVSEGLSPSRLVESESRGHISEEGEGTTPDQSRASRTPTPPNYLQKLEMIPLYSHKEEKEAVGASPPRSSDSSETPEDATTRKPKSSSALMPRRKPPNKFLKRAQSLSYVFKRNPEKKEKKRKMRDDFSIAHALPMPQGELALVPLEKLVQIEDIVMQPSLSSYNVYTNS